MSESGSGKIILGNQICARHVASGEQYAHFLERSSTSSARWVS
jgi:hypothetical protein